MVTIVFVYNNVYRVIYCFCHTQFDANIFIGSVRAQVTGSEEDALKDRAERERVPRVWFFFFVTARDKKKMISR